MEYKTILYKVDDHVLTITLNRPDMLNAFTNRMAQELIHAFDAADENDEVRAIVVTGAGRGFCAGADLSGGENAFNYDAHPNRESAQVDGVARDTGGMVALRIFDCKKPVIAAINGAAVGIGATMTCAMDIRLASDRARIGFVFNKIGITPEACSTWFLPRIVGISQALEWVYTAEILSAEDAMAGGLVKAVVPGDQLLEEAYKIARRIAQHSPVSIALSRQMMYRNAAQPDPVEAHKVDSLSMFYASISSGKEGVASFLEKRPAEFKDRTSTDMPPFYPWWK